MKSVKAKTKKAAKPVKKTGLAKKMPKKRQVRKIVIKKEKVKEEPTVFVLSLALRQAALKVMAMFLILALNWAGLSAIGETLAYFNDTEQVADNSYAVATLDFSLSSGADFSPSPLSFGQTSGRTIDVSQGGSLDFQYNVQAGDFSGDVCDYLNLEAKLAGDIKYQGPLKDFVYGPLLYSTSSPNSWHFALSLPDGIPDILQETTCQFKFVFSGWQDNLASSSEGFSDSEKILNSITTGKWVPELLTPLDNAVINGGYIKQCWSPVTEATKYLYQSCNNDPDADGYCNQRWYEEYSSSTQQFAQSCKWASGVANTDYWWRVKAVFGSASSSPGFSGAWKITVDNTHLNKVIMNEFLPNAIGLDDAPMPNGEWVELYNNKGQDVDVAGWVLYDVDNSHALPITNANTDTGGTLIRSGGYLVVYRNGDTDFALDNIGGDTVRLFDKAIGSGGTLIDSHSYTIDAPEGKSFARIPDGSNSWVDPAPTPGGPNILGDEEAILGSSEITIEPGEGDTVTLDSGSAFLQEAENNQIPPAIIVEGMVESADDVNLGLGPVLPLPPAELSPALDSALDSTTSLDQETITTTESTTTLPTETPDILLEIATSTAESTPVVIENTEPVPPETIDENPVAEPEPLVLEQPTVTLPEAPTLPENNSGAENSNSSDAVAGGDSPAPQTTGIE